MIYFAQATDGTGPIKIGYTVNLGQRRWQLQAKYKTPLKFLRVIEGDMELEKSIHEHFGRIRTHHPLDRKWYKPGEWFKPEPELLDFIENPTEVKPRDRYMPPPKSNQKCLAKVGFYRCDYRAHEGQIFCGNHLRHPPKELATDDTPDRRWNYTGITPAQATGLK